MSTGTPQPQPPHRPSGVLRRRFGVPPFSVLDARQGYWRERKQSWLDLGVAGELGRSAALTFAPSSQPPEVYQRKARLEQDLGHAVSWADFAAQCLAGQLGQTSEFDPVLCELAYCWFSGPGAAVLDPFAGGAVRGLVAAKLGRPYVGVDLRPEQVAANVRSARAAGIVGPRWITGDSRSIADLAQGAYDLIFTCPPYGDLEVYSDDPRDLSRMQYDEFLDAYQQIITASCELLRVDRFAAIVVGDIRDRRGNYRGFVADTIRAFNTAGLGLYNEAIYVPPYGSLPARAGRQFTASRKLGKAHQNLLVFCKGNAKAAVAAAGNVAPMDFANLA
jgi:hypothetical protein